MIQEGSENIYLGELKKIFLKHCIYLMGYLYLPYYKKVSIIF